MLRDIFYAVTDGFGYVIASIVGALVALTFSTDESFPNWYYIMTIMIALIGAVVIAILRRGVQYAFPRTPDYTSCPDVSIDEIGEAICVSHGEVIAELRALRAELGEMRRPWWRTSKKLRASPRRHDHKSAKASKS